MNIKGRSVYLRHITNADLDQLCLWRNREDFLAFCSCRHDKITREEFEEELQADFRRDRYEQFVIIRLYDNHLVGTIFSYNLNLTDGYVFITTYLDETYRRSGYGVEAMVLFGLYLFNTYSLHKLYCEVYEYNKLSLKALRGAGFVEEGRFKEQRLRKNQRWDVLRMAFFRKDLPRLEHIISRLQIR